MTREEAVEIFKERLRIAESYLDITDLGGYDNAMRMAIKSLELDPCNRTEYGTDGNIYEMSISNGKEYELKPCEDAISRQDVIADIYDKYMSSDGAVYNDTAKEIFGIIRNQPSVTPARSKGNWQPIRCDMYSCSVCDGIYTDLSGERENMNFCPNCGVEMEVQEE